MNDNNDSSATATGTQKSKRFSSIVWIFVLWFLVRLIAEIDGISWKRAFWGVSNMFGVIPATALLILAVVVPSRNIQKIFRWGAFLVALGSFFGGIAIHEQVKDDKQTDSLLEIFQIIFAASVLLIALVRMWLLRKREIDNG